MKNISLKLKLLAIILLLTFTACGPRQETGEQEMELFALYVGKDSIMPGDEGIRMVAEVDRTIGIPADIELAEKVRLLADSVSEYYFNGLEINILEIESGVLTLDLREPEAFEGPGSLPSYQSWYDYFQGSYGGQHTSIVLRQSFLQPGYKGNWIDDVIFYYQGEPLEEDHMPEL